MAGRNNIFYKPANRSADKLLVKQTLQGQRSKERLMCFNACYMFFQVMLAALIKYILSFVFRAEGEQELVTVIRSALH